MFVDQPQEPAAVDTQEPRSRAAIVPRTLECLPYVMTLDIRQGGPVA